MNIYAIHYEHAGERYHTLVQAPSQRQAAVLFIRQNPHVIFIRCVPA